MIRKVITLALDGLTCSITHYPATFKEVQDYFGAPDRMDGIRSNPDYKWLREIFYCGQWVKFQITINKNSLMKGKKRFNANDLKIEDVNDIEIMTNPDIFSFIKNVFDHLIRHIYIDLEARYIIKSIFTKVELT